MNNEEKKLLAFALFSTAMRFPKDMLPKFQQIVDKLGVHEEYENYAKDFLNFSSKNKN